MIITARTTAGLAVLLAGLLCFAPQAQADTTAATLNRGKPATARVAAQAVIKDRADANLLRSQLAGMSALRQGKIDEAVQIFRALLAEAPKFQPASQQLAVALQMRQQTDHSAAKPRKGGVGLRFGLLPSSNITGGVAGDTIVVGGLPFTLDPAARSAAGMGVTFGVTAWQGWDFGNSLQGVFQSSLDIRRFDTQLKPAETEVALQFDLGKKGRTSSFGFGPRLGLLWQGGTLYKRSAGLGFSATAAADRTLRFGLSGEWRAQDFPARSYRDGHATTLMTDMNWQITPKLGLLTQLSGTHETARAAHLSHRDLGLSMAISARLSPNTLFGLSLSAAHTRYGDLYPGFDIARKDDVLAVGLSFQDNRLSWRGITPLLSLRRKHQSSNIVFHDSWSTEFGLILTKQF